MCDLPRRWLRFRRIQSQHPAQQRRPVHSPCAHFLCTGLSFWTPSTQVSPDIFLYPEDPSYVASAWASLHTPGGTGSRPTKSHLSPTRTKPKSLQIPTPLSSAARRGWDRRTIHSPHPCICNSPRGPRGFCTSGRRSSPRPVLCVCTIASGRKSISSTIRKYLKRTGQ
jgi:hypothetical protein